MKQTLVIQVFANQEAKNARKPIFERIVYTDDSVCVNYSQHIDSLRFLFGRSCIVTFSCETL